MLAPCYFLALNLFQMKHFNESWKCPVSRAETTSDDTTVISTNWNYLQTMKINELAPSPNISAVTPLNGSKNERRFVPWLWPDDDLNHSVNIRQRAFLDGQDRILKTADDDPVIRAASQQLLWIQAQYLSEHFPEKYSIEQNRRFGKVIINKANENKIDMFSLLPEKDDWHPLAISGLLGQEDICIVRRKKSGRQILAAGFLASPTNWNLSNFMNADMDTIHQQVDGYNKPNGSRYKYRLKDTVDKMLESLGEYPNGIICRNNQFIEYIPTLAREPNDNQEFKKGKVSKNPGDQIFLRTERETLTRLPAPYDDFTVFTIKPHVFRMSDVRHFRGADFARALMANSVLRSALKSDNEKNEFDFTQLLEKYLTAEN